MRVLLISADLMIASMLEGAARGAGAELVVASVAVAAEQLSAAPCRLAIIDLASAADVPALIESLRAAAPEVRLLAFGPHVHKAKLEQAQQAGCEFVMSRGQFHNSAGAILAELAKAN
ncbi:hypothetical protein Pla123a_23320 [Posidoniimonas polymericola]|uniref:Response regulatory domain-containing protein n=1 Tax=Posidoniimonas polymericola TaxID=2528002 RepID=A0A5C5YQ61_9BACT|nr:hypothetical protein [Posidoniimonas polymericola]TWT76907.1 hypothetical protein Pla123a_23320 [Posidoniimonas polymericola]